MQSASIAVSLFFLSGGVAGLAVARWVNDYDPRICIAGGAVICAGSLTAISLVSTVGQLYLLYVIFGLGFAGSNLIPATTLVTRWFQRKRARALSIASTGLSLGGVVITPICALLVENIGLDRAAPIMGLMYLFGVIPVSLIWLRPNPESMGLLVDGDSHNLSTTHIDKGIDAQKPVSSVPLGSSMNTGISFAEARRGRLFLGNQSRLYISHGRTGWRHLAPVWPRT